MVWVDFAAPERNRFTLISYHDWERDRDVLYIKNNREADRWPGHEFGPKYIPDESDKAVLSRRIYLEIRRRWPRLSIREGGKDWLSATQEGRQKVALCKMYYYLKSDSRKSN